MPDGPTPPNGSLVVRELEDQVVDQHAAGRHLLDHPLADRLGLGEQVGGQRLGPRVDESDCLVEVLDGEHRQDRPEDLVGHQRLVRDRDRRRRSARSAGSPASEPPPMATLPLVAASAAVSRSKWRSLTMRMPPVSSASKRRDGVADLGDQLVADRRVGQHIVRRDADLAGVDQLGPGDALGGDVDVGVGCDDHRALAAQFQGDRGQVRRRALVDLAADLGAAGEAQPVEALRDELLADRAVALDHRDRLVVQIARHQLGHQRRRRRGDLGWLEHHGVSGGDRADSRPERQREREVPGADDQHRAVGLVLDPAAAGQLRELQQPVLAPGPLADVLGGVASPRRRCWRCRPARPRTACGRGPASSAAAMAGSFSVISCSSALQLRRGATRPAGCGRWRRSCEVRRRWPGCPPVRGAADAVASVDSVVMAGPS